MREVISDDALYRAKESELLDQRNHLHLALAEAEEELARIRDTAHNGYAFAAFARDTFLSGDMEGRRELTSALGFSYLLYGHEVAIEVDPLLKEMVQFAQSISLMFEPQPGGSRSRYRASFSSCKDFGRAKDHRFQPGASLQALLKTRAFPLFTWPSHSITTQNG
ncbi:MAG TPA: hypothetical protein VGB77_08060 [Abditibacteriaceae bacterium]